MGGSVVACLKKGSSRLREATTDRTLNFRGVLSKTTSSHPEYAAQETLAFLRGRSADLGTTLPPLGKTPRRWPAALKAPAGATISFDDRPAAFLLGVLKSTRGSVILQAVLLTVNFVSGAMLSVVIGRGVDAGIDSGLSAPVWRWVGVFVALVLVLTLTNGLNQLTEITSWMRGAFNPARSVSHRVARAGRAAKQEKPAGDVVTALLNDSDHVGSFVVFTAEVIAALISFLVVAAMLLSMSVPLGLVIVIGFPLTVLGVAALAKPIQRKLAHQREEQGKLTTISTDAVTGLRVLRGIGGEDYYNKRYQEQSTRVRTAAIKVASDQALLAVMRSSVPMLFVAVVAGFGSMLVFEGQMTPGELLTFVGLTAFLANPINVAAWAAQIGTRAWVGVKKLAEFNALEPAVGVTDPPFPDASPDFAGQDLTDVASGIRVGHGKLTALVAPSPDISSAIARRLARIDDRDEVQLGESDLRDFPLQTVREGILLSEADAQLFRGTLHAALRGRAAADPSPRGTTELVYREHLEEAARSEGSLFRADRVPDDPRLEQAMYVADAADVLDSLEGRMAGWLTERGRNLSGGQRQRVALARAVYADAPVLIAVEPTSAVDSHTEERIASRLRAERQGKTTLIVSASPLWLEKCDEIVVVDDTGAEVARGTHGELKAAAADGDPGALLYRRTIAREAGETDEAARS